VRQILAFIEKDVLLEIRIKANVLSRFFNPLIQLFLYILLFGIIFNIQTGYNLGYWNANNYLLFLLLAFCIQFTKTIMNKYRQLFLIEKYWKTLSAIMIAPVNRITLLLGGLFSELVMVSIPFITLFVIALVIYPIPFLNLLLVLLILFLIFIVFGSIGLLIGAFSISQEEYVYYSEIALRILFLISCINFPKEIFPKIVQGFVGLNPFYYLFDLLRLSWYMGINYEISISLITPIHIIAVIGLAVLSPLIASYLFNKIYKKYGITGY
ncbi:MAG: ABC transporter permease, partial [Candidatus Thorarchaeota archaeon]